MLKNTLTSSLGINFVGHVSGEYGLGEGARGTLRGMESVGIPFTINDIKVDWHRNLDDSYTNVSQNIQYPINLIHINPGDGMIEGLGTEYFKGRYNIGYWAWELPILPRVWEYAFDLFDEIWTYSNYTAETIARQSPIPVLKLPPSIALPSTSVDRKALGLPQGKFVFLFMFDFHSTLARKNTLGTIEAFKQAFPQSNNEDVLLVIKSSNGHFHPQQREQLKEQAEDWPSIRLIDGHLKKEELYGLVKSCDCYVSLHRAEGFGLTMAEAMYYGKPVIATAYSSNMEFMNVGNSFPVKYDLVTLAENYGPYSQGNVWAEPDIDHAASLMQYVFQNYQEAQQVGAKAAQDIKSLLSPQAVGNKIRNRLEQIMKIRITRELAQAKVQLPVFKDEAFLQQTEGLNDGLFLEVAYETYLKRKPDKEGKNHHIQDLGNGSRTRQDLLTILRQSPEFESLWKLLKKELLSSSLGLEVISIHVPKTAGITFGKVLQQVYGAEQVFWEDGKLPLATILDQRLIRLQTQVIHGQFPASRYKECLLYSSPKLIAWLRHPITRLISGYCDCIGKPAEASENDFQEDVNKTQPDLVEFAEMPENQNVISEYLRGIEITDFFFIGIQEFFQDDLNNLKEILDWPELEIGWNNKNKYQGYHTYVNKVLGDKNMVAKLAALNSDDIEVYQTALNLRQKRKAITRIIS
ncbi:glycosyltransferase [Microcoleus vaginatus]|uniref:glycosyltransferase n=1 Tax=Microcoleus vaginatus TaxID=119532 RepID=UPI001F619071|nr:glycosyltransferase [Microcoleus vaginatus HSN003]